MSVPAIETATTAGAALAAILTDRLGDSHQATLDGIASLSEAVDAHFARSTGTIVVDFTDRGLTATFPGEPKKEHVVLGRFANYRTISLTDELLVSNGTQWRKPI